MAKKSKIVREYKLIKNVQKYAALRAELKDIIRSPKTSAEDKKAKIAEDNLQVALKQEIGEGLVNVDRE